MGHALVVANDIQMNYFVFYSTFCFVEASPFARHVLIPLNGFFGHFEIRWFGRIGRTGRTKKSGQGFGLGSAGETSWNETLKNTKNRIETNFRNFSRFWHKPDNLRLHPGIPRLHGCRRRGRQHAWRREQRVRRPLFKHAATYVVLQYVGIHYKVSLG